MADAGTVTGSIKTAKTACEFFRINYGTDKNDGSVCLADLLDQLHKVCPSIQDRNYTDGVDLFRMFDYFRTSSGCRGALLRLKTGARAEKASIDSDDIEDVPLLPGEHIVETLTFVYFRESATVVLQRNRDVGGPNTLASYIRNKGGYLSLTFEALFNSDAMKRLGNFQRIKRAEFRIAVPMRNLFNSLDGYAVGEFIDFARANQSATVTIILSSGQSKQPLLAKSVKDFASETLSVLGVGKKGSVKSAKVKGAANDLAPDQLLDLIADKVVESVEVHYTGDKPTRLDYFNALNYAYNVRRDELYIPPEGGKDNRPKPPTPKEPS